MKLELSGQIFEKSSNVNFHGKPSSWSRVFPCGWTDGLTDMTKLIVAVRSFANASKYRNHLKNVMSDNVKLLKGNLE